MILTGTLFACFCSLWLLFTQLASLVYRKDPLLCVTPSMQTQQEEILEFPFEIPGTTLIAEQIVSYDGLVTIGENTDNATNVAALLLYNYGEYGIQDAQVLLQAGQVQFVFVADTIPAGERLLVPEREGKEYGPNTFSSSSGWQRVDTTNWSAEEQIRLQYPQMGAIDVTNITDTVLTDIYLQYKTYYAEADFYVGSMTHTYRIDMLQPGEYIRIYPQFYALGYSKIVRVKIEK